MRLQFTTLMLVLGASLSALAGGKETIRQKMEKTAAAGKKIAVVTNPSKVFMDWKTGDNFPGICRNLDSQVQPMPAGYNDVAKAVADEFNKGFEMEAVEWVDISTIPSIRAPKDGKMVLVQDWASTDYGMVISIDLKVDFTSHIDNVAAKFEAQVLMTVGELESGKKTLTEVFKQKEIAYNSTELVNLESCLGNIPAAVEKLGKTDQFVDASIEDAKTKLAVILEKENKKYAKVKK